VLVVSQENLPKEGESLRAFFMRSIEYSCFGFVFDGESWESGETPFELGGDELARNIFSYFKVVEQPKIQALIRMAAKQNKVKVTLLIHKLKTELSQVKSSFRSP
jgi:hypothetical protein